MVLIFYFDGCHFIFYQFSCLSLYLFRIYDILNKYFLDFMKLSFYNSSQTLRDICILGI